MRKDTGVSVPAVLLAVVIVMSTLFLIAHIVAANKVADGYDAWETRLGSLDQLLEEYPTTVTDETGWELERLANEVGISLVPRGDRGRKPLGTEVEKRWDTVKGSMIKKYLNAILVSQELGASATMPEEPAAFLEEYGASLEQVRDYLNDGAQPVWTSDFSAMMHAPIPNLLGHIDLHRLLMVAAHQQRLAGNEAEGEAYLEAGWNLLQPLRETPYLINQLIALAQVRYLVGSLRHFESVSPQWDARLASLDVRADITRSLQYEGWVWLSLDKMPNAADSGVQSAINFMTRPYARYCAAETSLGWFDSLESFLEQDVICDDPLVIDTLDVEIPPWNVLGEVMVVNYRSVIERMANAQIQIEMTEQLLAARRGERIDGPSRFCPNDHWSTIEADGMTTVALSRQPKWDLAVVGVRLPLESSFTNAQ